MDREQPKTDHDLLVSLWTLLIGTNGNGLLSRFDIFAAETRTRLSALESKIPGFWTRADHEEYLLSEAECDDRRENRRKISGREWALVVVSVLGPIIAVVIAHFVK